MAGIAGFLQDILRSVFYDDGTDVSIRLHGESTTEGSAPTGNPNDLQDQATI